MFGTYVLLYILAFAGVLAGSLQELKLEASVYKQATYADSTKKTYRSQIKSFYTFCLKYGLIPIPASQETLCLYMTFLVRSLSANSIPGYMNVIRIIHMEAGYANPLDKNWELKLLHRGITRLIGVPPKQKLPISVEILLKISRTLSNLPSDIAFWACCVIAFFGFMRKSTLLPLPDALASGKFIARSDVSNFSLSSFFVTIKHSKTIQFGQRVHVLPFVACPDTRICPVRGLLRHFGVSPLPKTAPLFNYVVGSGEVNFSHAFFVKRLRKALLDIGENPKEISCHSFRRGGATLAYMAGLSAADIKLRGDWASSAYERYLCVSNDMALVSARKLVYFASTC
jgi:integrase